MDKGLIEIDSKIREYTIERKKTNIIKYKVYPDLTIKVIAPKFLPLHEIHSHVAERKNWFKKHLDHFTVNRPKEKPELQNGSTVRLLGEQYTLIINESKKDSVEMLNQLFDRFILINAKSAAPQYIEALLDRWYKVNSVPYFKTMMNKCLVKLSKYSIPTPKLFVRKMKSRWGSCIKSKAKITLNTMLMKESPGFVEYVVMHELCHLKHANHSKHFYSFLESVMPDWKEKKNELKKNR